jgi:hypothetical protein
MSARLAAGPERSFGETLMSAFVVRPFGTKNGIDFDKVHRELIAPAMARLGLQGGTTEPITRAGNIRADMFGLLAKADIVIADISIHNANVFYELGARHALRDKRTFLIRSRSDEVPFDLRTDRYLEYDKNDPGASIEKLVTGLKQTIEEPATDSPIFQLVPKLEPQDWTRLVVVPEDFQEEVEKAAQGRHRGDLELLSLEAQAFDWAPEGLRLVGRAQSALGAWEGARATWEAMKRRLEGDHEIDLRLGTVYQRLGDLASSDLALKRAIDDPDITDRERAEAYALLGSNDKSRWVGTWKTAPDEDKGERALGSRYLQQAQDYCAEGFASDLNHFYSGINALALQTIMAELARAHPDIWAIDFDSADEAARALEKVEAERRQLEGAVGLSVERELRRLSRLGKKDRWADITRADLGLLTVKKPERVARLYRKALEGAEDFYFDSVRRQLALYRDLGVLADNTGAALAEIDRLEREAGITHARQDGAKPHVLLFTGHRIDAPGRTEPRFPAEKEAVARAAIEDAVAKEQARISARLTGIAGGASGGDVLFHEVCAELGIETQLYLAIPPAQYIVASVAVPDHPEWIDRFHAVEKSSRKTRTLSQEKELPKWLKARADYSIWQRNNLWMLHNALAYGGRNVTLIALWNGKAGDGPGGTKDMVDQARARGAKVIILDTGKLFGL